MLIAMLCATQRGLRCLEVVHELYPGAGITVFTFRETPWEPPYVADIHDYARAAGIGFCEATRVESADLPGWSWCDVDLLLAVNWRYLVPELVYTQPRCGSYLLHDSLLPKYRGFSPTVWAIANGEPETGVTLLEMDREIDSGAIVSQEPVPIGPDEHIGEVTEKVTAVCQEVLRREIPRLLSGEATRTPQDAAAATYCCRRRPEDARIDWRVGREGVFNLIRSASRPYTGAYSYLHTRRLRVWRAELPPGAKHYAGIVPGRVAAFSKDEGWADVLAADGPVRLWELEADEGGPASAASFMSHLSCTLS